jgi:hypothetical protein
LKLPGRPWIVVAAFAGAIFYIALYVSGAHSEGYKFLDQAIRSAPSIRAQLGDVKAIALSFIGGYRSKFVGDNEWVTMKLNVSGQKGDGTVAASAKRINGVWSVTNASMDGRPIALSRTSTPASNLSAPTEKQLSTAELLKLYDPSSLVETKTLEALPADLQSVIGVHATGYARLADVGEPCNPTDVVGNDPGRCFSVGGVSPTSALVAFKIGGYAGQSGVGE